MIRFDLVWVDVGELKELSSLEGFSFEEKLKIVDSLLRTLNTPEPAIDLEWGKVAESRLEELRSGRVKAIPGKKVIKNIQTHLKK